MALPGASRKEYVDGYRAHLNFLNKRITATLETILAASERPPVIVVQGDHGPGSRLDFTSVKGTYLKERFGILNAYYLPEGEDERLYDSISPVNTFRLVLNRYFGTQLPLLDDRSYFTTGQDPYRFIPVERALIAEDYRSSN